jgi:hypothetical integral membrane protein (TIGR02206 family)
MISAISQQETAVMLERLIAKDYPGAPFELFGGPHLVILGLVLLLNVGLIVYGRRIPERWRPRLRYILAFVLFINEVLWHWWNAATGQWTIQKMLPLHLCSVLVWLSQVMLVTKNVTIYELVYLLGIAGALQALLTPDAGQYGFPHFRFFQTMISHGSIVTAGVWMTAVEGLRPYPQSIKRIVGIGLAYMAAIGLVNALIGSNYLFIARKPDTASLLDVMPAWPWYIPILLLIAAVMIGLVYLPFAVKDWRTRVND